ncbi:MAG: aldo/keto reductase [Chloroflexi bacterium]|nr:aldo/keto reductase [Chloroflexota bacterium]
MDERASFALLDAYAELGGNFVDTAHDYGNWVPELPRSVSERTIGAWLRSRAARQRTVLASKGGCPDASQPTMKRLGRTDLERDLDEGLRYLGTDYIDLYWLHRDDPDRPVGDMLETMNDQVRAGKIRYFGASNWKVSRIREAQAYAAAHGLHGFVGDQIWWNAAVLAGPAWGNPTMGWMDDGGRHSFHTATGMAVIPYQSQAYGLFHRLANGTLGQMKPRFVAFYDLAATERRYGVMTRIMRETGLTIGQVVLGYLRSQPFTTIPIVGCQNPDQVRDSMSAADVLLTPAQLASIESA